ncbi:MAG: serine/threonine-protein kinase, partial [Polyangiaceae bacterium]
HRDVSPQNILVGVDGSSRVIDFGIAKARHRLTETKSGSLKGKYSYMAPEQTRGMEVDRRADIFAWGVVLHEMLTGDRLFRGENEFDTMRRIWEMPIPDPSKVNPAVPRALDAVVHRALARDVAVRFATAHEALDALEKAVPIGSPRDVAAFVERASGERHRERRRALHGMLEGRVAPLALELPLDKDDSQTTLSPQSHSQIPTAYGSEANIAVAQRTIVDIPHPKNQTPLVLILMAGVGSVAMVAAGIVIFLFAFRAPPQAMAASAAANVTAQASAVETSPTGSDTAATPNIEFSATEATTATAPAIAPGEVVLTLHSTQPIVSVRAPGSHKIEIKGKTATIVLSSWTDKLRVDAIADGGRKGFAVVPSGASSADLFFPVPKNTTTTSTTTTRDPNLQANPY